MAGGLFVAIASFILAQNLMKRAEVDQIADPVTPIFGKHQRSFKIMHLRR
jgi:hypothetical protein